MNLNSPRRAGMYMNMDPQLTELLRNLEDDARQRGETPRIVREAGQFLNIVAKATRATNLLQVGIGDGYLALWLAEAASSMGGQLIAIENDVWQYDAAMHVIEHAPCAENIHLLQGEIAELLPVLEGPFNFVLLDADKGQTLYHLRTIFEQISSGSLICCNRAMSQAGMLADYLTFVHERPGLESTLVPVGEGIEMTYKTP